MTDKIKIIVEAGLTHSQARALLARLETHSDKFTPSALDRDWEKLLKPLHAHILQLQKSASKRTDKSWAALYKRYVAHLIEIRARIQNAQAVALLSGESIQTAAASRGVTEYNGRRWYAWAPLEMRLKVIASFLAAQTEARKLSPTTTLLVPYKTPFEKSANERRWDILLSRIHTLKSTFYPPDSRAQGYLDSALMLASKRSLNTPAPMQWAHILPKELQQQFHAWQAETMNGMDEPPPNDPLLDDEDVI